MTFDKGKNGDFDDLPGLVVVRRRECKCRDLSDGESLVLPGQPLLCQVDFLVHQLHIVDGQRPVGRLGRLRQTLQDTQETTGVAVVLGWLRHVHVQAGPTGSHIG